MVSRVTDVWGILGNERQIAYLRVGTKILIFAIKYDDINLLILYVVFDVV